jgi:hypothetical protein
MGDSLPSKEKIPIEQRKDPFCNTRKPGTHHSSNKYVLDDGVLYKLRSNLKYQLVVPKSLIWNNIKANHNPVYVAHPGMKGTFNLISLSYWWSGMRKSVKLKKSDPCQRRKEEREFLAPLEAEKPTFLFEITSMDITDPYLVTPC